MQVVTRIHIKTTIISIIRKTTTIVATLTHIGEMIRVLMVTKVVEILVKEWEERITKEETTTITTQINSTLRMMATVKRITNGEEAKITIQGTIKEVISIIITEIIIMEVDITTINLISRELEIIK